MPVIGTADGEQHDSMFEASVSEYLKRTTQPEDPIETPSEEDQLSDTSHLDQNQPLRWGLQDVIDTREQRNKADELAKTLGDIGENNFMVFQTARPQEISMIKKGQPQIDDPFTEASKLGAIRGGPRSGKTTKSNEPPTETSPMYASENITPPKLIYEKQKGDLSLRTYKEEPIYENVTSHGINFEKGSVQGTINIHSLDGGKTVHVGYMGAINTETGQAVRSLGPKSVKDIYAHIKEIYPNVETIQAQRVSGMRAEMDKKYGGKRILQDLQLDVKTGKVSQRSED